MPEIHFSKNEIAEGAAKGFEWQVEGKIFRGIVGREKGKFFAYHNLCRHLPIPIDAGDGDFYSEDHRYLQCHMHGALYEIDTGKCVGGPCLDAYLKQIPFQETEDKIIILGH